MEGMEATEINMTMNILFALDELFTTTCCHVLDTAIQGIKTIFMSFQL